MADNQKITVRKIKELSGVAKATVEKYYKLILSQISQDNASDNLIDVLENKVSEIDSNKAVLDNMKSRLEEHFKTIVTGPKIVHDLISVLGYNTTKKIPLERWPELINGVNQDRFETFWSNLQANKTIFEKRVQL